MQDYKKKTVDTSKRRKDLEERATSWAALAGTETHRRSMWL